MANQEENNQAAVTVDTSKVAPDVILDFLARGIQGEIYNFVESYLGGISEALKSRMFCEYVVLNIRFTILSYVESVGGSKEEYLQAIGEYAQNIHMESTEGRKFLQFHILPDINTVCHQFGNTLIHLFNMNDLLRSSFIFFYLSFNS